MFSAVGLSFIQPQRTGEQGVFAEEKHINQHKLVI